jgi:3-oxoacyl-[acyl-carrier-protein] synthase-3
MNSIRNCRIAGYGTYLPKQTVEFEGQTRYRISGDEDQLSMAVAACKQALGTAELDINNIDCIVSASAVGIQPIPSTAALIHEQLALGTSIPALDINTTCTSFLTALDTMSYLVAAGRYKNVLIVSSEVGSLGLNPKQRESYELFSDGAAAIVLSADTEPSQGIIASMQSTWSEGAHSTEIRGGLTGFHPKNYSEETKEDYMFDMDGRAVLRIAATHLPEMFDEFKTDYGIGFKDVDVIIPHQASRALDMIMWRMGAQNGSYINWVPEYGNMVSASVPFILCKLLADGKLQRGDKVLLCGTAAGLTANIVVMEV